MIGGHLLDFAFDPGLWCVFHDNICPPQNVRMQFGLPRTVTADGVDMHAGTYLVVRQDGGILFVRGNRRDDVGAPHRVLRRGTGGDVESHLDQVRAAFPRGGRIDVIEPQPADSQRGAKRQRLEL